MNWRHLGRFFHPFLILQGTEHADVLRASAACKQGEKASVCTLPQAGISLHHARQTETQFLPKA